MKIYLTLVMLLAAGTAVGTPMPSTSMPSREKPNALGFHQHQPKSSLHNYTPGRPVQPAADAESLTADPSVTTGDSSGTTPSTGPGRMAPIDKPTIATTTPGPGRMTPPVDKTKTSPPEACITQHMGGSDSVPWGCAVRKPPKQIPEPSTYALLAIGLLASWLAARANRRQFRLGQSTRA